MRLNPIRRTQLISPFGPGALHVLEGGVAVVTGGLDEWFKDRNGNPADSQEIAKGPLVVREPRLEMPLGVSHFRVAPGPENRGDTDDPELVTPVFRFPTWFVCPRCSRMKQSKLTQSGYLTECLTPECRPGRLVQLRFAAVCDHGHLQDFPWMEWVHRDATPHSACANKLFYSAEGSGSLESIRIECEHCKISRSLAGVMSGEFPKKAGDMGWSGLTRDLLSKPGASKSSEDSLSFPCQGHKPWQGPVLHDKCDRPLRAVLINATNVHYADVRSAIYIPPRFRPSASQLLTILDETDFRNLIAMCRRADDEIEDIVKKLRKRDKASASGRLDAYGDSEIEAAFFGHVEAPPSNHEVTGMHSASRAEQEAQIKRDEFEAFLGETDREGELVLRNVDASALPQELEAWIDRVVAIEKLRETRVFAGFSRLMGRPPKGAPTAAHLLWREYPKEFKNRWLPASVVRGEGIFLRFSEEKIREWEARPEVLAHLAPLQQNHDACVLRYNWEERVIEPRFVLLHTLAHLMIKRLVFECGYGSASLRERLYVSSEEGKEMAGILIYTAAGDSEGTMGGLVRLADPDNLGRILINAIEEAQWCSADPVCGEAASSGGQGPDSLNLAACHSCALLPETSCEHFNKFLDRTLVLEGRAPSIYTVK